MFITSREKENANVTLYSRSSHYFEVHPVNRISHTCHPINPDEPSNRTFGLRNTKDVPARRNLFPDFGYYKNKYLNYRFNQFQVQVIYANIIIYIFSYANILHVTTSYINFREIHHTLISVMLRAF